MGDHYQLLQVQPNADDAVIEAAYKALSKRNGTFFSKDKDLAARLAEARDTLIDGREDYDAHLRKGLDNMIGPYKVVKKMAEGGMGRVYEARHTLLDEKVCIKHTLNISQQDSELLRKEAKSIWNLRHHALPTVRDFYQLPDGSCALVMSYIEGPTFQELIEEGTTGKKWQENVCWITGRVLDALRYVHYHGVVHGDVKPANIIVQPDVHSAVLVDFGIASIKPGRNSSADGYTAPFASPEHTGDKPLLPQSDLYSLGMTMAYALGGELGVPKVPKKVPEPLRDFVHDLLIKDVRKRPHWGKEHLLQKLRNVRVQAFGRATSYKA